MADRAVSLGPRILVVAALESTLKPTIELLQESASMLQAEVELQVVVAQDAWQHFIDGNHAAYIAAICQTVQAAASTDISAIVLAQASMAPAAEVLRGFGVEVLSSPQLGVQSLIARIYNAG
ncbi:hypothetical protein [Rhodoferax sp.]|uniref:hypothetical protein n=1 Tax=Rhodoferax sp. TaxID=50421 RepID=UPI0025D65042|nr:hypothetical protein [Rhodoferax sp.]